MENPSEEISTPKRVPRKRAVNTVAGAEQKPARKRAPRKASVTQTEPVERVSSSERKAPTEFGECQMTKRRRQQHIMIAVGLLVVGVAASAAIGFTDKGQIDVQQTIEDRNERIRTNTADARDTLTSSVEVPVQNTNSVGKPDGGLRGRAPGEIVPKPTPEFATTTASTSDQTASSTNTTAVSSDESINVDSNDDSLSETETEEVSQ